MGFKDLLVKLGILKSGASAGTYKNAEERTDVMGVNEEVAIDDDDSDSDSDSDSGSDD
jgi:hypothetical protein